MRAGTASTAEIVSIGTELLLGTITDTNATYLAQRLAAAGFNCHFISQVGDNQERIVGVLRRAWERSDIVVTTGGLGPTQDDLTRESIAALLGEEMSIDAELERHLLSLYTRRGIRMPESNRKQATLIPSARAIENPVGTAPGWWVAYGGSSGNSQRQIISMPGVPFEMKRMWEREVEPELAPQASSIIVSRTLKVMGLGESRVEEMVADLMGGSNPTLAPYAKNDGIHLRLTAKAHDRLIAESMLEPLEGQVRTRLGNAIYGMDGDTPQSVVGALLTASGLSFVVVEIGDRAIGSVGALLGGHELCCGVFGGRDLETLRTLALGAGQLTGGTVLDPIAEAITERSGASLALVVEVEAEPLGDDSSAVQFTALVKVLRAGAECESVTYSWRTTPSEVGRLVGLAALNLLRHNFFAMVREKELGAAT